MSDTLKKYASKTIRHPRITGGVLLILLSYLAGWPLVGLFGILSAWLERPEMARIWAPAAYTSSYLLFFVGILMVGQQFPKESILKRLSRLVRLK